MGEEVGFLPGGRTWRSPPRHGLLCSRTRIPARAGGEQRRGRWSVWSGGSSSAAAAAPAAFSQPQQHGGSGHTERATDARPRAGARTLGPSVRGRGKGGGPSRSDGGGARAEGHAPGDGRGSRPAECSGLGKDWCRRPAGGGRDRWVMGEAETQRWSYIFWRGILS